MESYEQKYKEAIENIKKIKAANSDNKALVDFIEYQYPELKESEDEKIRKSIINLVENGISSKENTHYFFDDFSKDEMVSWLEKQKSVVWSEEDDGIRKAIIAHFQCNIEEMACSGMDDYEYEAEIEEQNKYLHWLISLQPNRWKPTKNQIEELQNAARGHIYEAGTLLELYDKLLKL